MLMNLGPMLVMVMPVGYAANEQENCKYNYVKSLDSYIPIKERQRKTMRKRGREE